MIEILTRVHWRVEHLTRQDFPAIMSDWCISRQVVVEFLVVAWRLKYIEDQPPSGVCPFWGSSSCLLVWYWQKPMHDTWHLHHTRVNIGQDNLHSQATLVFECSLSLLFGISEIPYFYLNVIYECMGQLSAACPQSIWSVCLIENACSSLIEEGMKETTEFP